MATPCSEPAAHVVVDFHSGRGDVQVRTDALGRYRVRLRAGRYVVRVSPVPPIGRGIEPTALLVRTSMRADFNIDTGIR